MKVYTLLFLLVINTWVVLCQETTSNFADTLLIKKHLTVITKSKPYRNFQNPKALDSMARYIYSVFSNYCDTVYFQEYTVNGIVYKNVIGRFYFSNKERIVVGAHYDVCGNQAGADDNASGVVGLLELARMLKNKATHYPIELVAYCLEEPPFFRTESMGSYIHAKSLYDAHVAVKGMISLEMIGFFSEEHKSQEYPLPHKVLIYGDKANYIMIVGKITSNIFCNEMKKLMKHADLVDTKSISAPAAIPGIDFSDHLNYWDLGFNALMITNTSFYRNPNYHLSSDTMETLDLPKMASVIDEVFYALIQLK